VIKYIRLAMVSTKLASSERKLVRENAQLNISSRVLNNFVIFRKNTTAVVPKQPPITLHVAGHLYYHFEGTAAHLHLCTLTYYVPLFTASLVFLDTSLMNKLQLFHFPLMREDVIDIAR
jgi:hypothetical protein